MRRRTVIAVSTGAAVLCLTQWGWEQMIQAGLWATIMKAPTALQWAGSLGITASQALLPLLPGLCTGAISGRRGIVLGALTGIIGGVIYSALFAVVHRHYAQLSHTFTWFLVLGFGLPISCAAGGAVGELLRSNNRWRDP